MFRKLFYFVSIFVVVGLICPAMAQEVDMEIGIGSPVIDGEADDVWAGASEQSFVPLADPADGSGIWKALYDAENLYVLVDVTDDSLQNDSASSWQDDSVEIYFDGGNTKLSTPLSGDDHQYTFGWTASDVQGTNITGAIAGIEQAQVTTGTGWRIEVKMPWMSIWGVVPQAGDLIGIDCYYNDDDDGGDSREGKMLGFSAIEGWNDASQWGTAILAAVPGSEPVNPGAEGLVAHYAFENDVDDSSGNGLNGTIIGDPTFVAGVKGMALDFNGNDYLDCGGVAEFSFTDAMTVSTWVNVRSVTTAWMAMVAKGENAWRLGFNNLTTGVHYAFSGGTRGWQAANTATELAFGEWYHVAATYDTNVGAIVYINGQPDASNTNLDGIDVNQKSLLIGDNPEATGRLLDGMLDEVMIYNRALSEAEIRYLAIEWVQVPVENFSFELPGTEKIKGWNGEGVAGTPAVDVPGWNSDTVVADSGVESDWPGSTEGVWTGFMMGSDPSVWNLTGHVIGGDEKFRLLVDLQDNWTDGGAPQVLISLYYDDAGTRVTVASTTVTPLDQGEGGWSEFSLEFTAADVPDSVGKLLGIEIDNVSTTDSWIGVDNVRLSFTPPPKPVENLVLNPSFEEDEVVLDDPDWYAWATWNPAEGAGSNATIVDTDAADGARSLLIEPVGSENWYFIVLSLPIPTEVGAGYTASFKAKAAEARPLGVQFKSTDNTVQWGYTDFQLTTEWAEYSLTSDALNAETKLEFFCAGVGVAFWLDSVAVYKVSDAPPPQEEEVPPPAPGVNQLGHGGFEDGPATPLNTWAPKEWSIYGEGCSMEVVSEGAIEGAYCLKVTVPAATTDYWSLGFKQGGHVFVKDRSYTLSAWMKSNSGPLSVNLKLERDGGDYSGTEQMASITEEWAQYSVTTPVYAATVEPAAATFHIGWAAGEFLVDDVQLYEN